LCFVLLSMGRPKRSSPLKAGTTYSAEEAVVTRILYIADNSDERGRSHPFGTHSIIGMCLGFSIGEGETGTSLVSLHHHFFSKDGKTTVSLSMAFFVENRSFGNTFLLIVY